MANGRSFTDPFGIVDHTGVAINVPNKWNLPGQLGIFAEQGVAQSVVDVEEITKSFGQIKDSAYNVRTQVNKDYTRKIRSQAIPHFGIIDGISPRDLRGIRAYGSDSVETLDAVRLRKIEAIRASFDQTKEYARFKLLTSGDIYAPNGTVSTNVFTEYGVSQKVVDFDLGTSTTNIGAKCREVADYIQDNALTGDIMDGIVAPVSSEFFDKLVIHAKVQGAYQTVVDPLLRNRLPNGQFDARYEVFRLFGIDFVRVRDTFAAGRGIAANDGFAVPTGTTNVFSTFYAPPERFDTVNQLGESLYVWEEMKSQDLIEITAESNFLNWCARPQVIVRCHTST